MISVSFFMYTPCFNIIVVAVFFFKLIKFCTICFHIDFYGKRIVKDNVTLCLIIYLSILIFFFAGYGQYYINTCIYVDNKLQDTAIM